MNSRKRKVTIRIENPNPLFTKWLTEWRDEALEKNSKAYNSFNLALKALNKYPLPLASGKECAILKGFGEKLCRMLDNKLKESHTKPAKTKRNSRSNNYVPVYRSGAYAILLTLYQQSLESDYKGYLTKTEIINLGQTHCDKSFTRPEPGTFYTSWSSMKTLLDKNLIIKNSSPAKYLLTAEGKILGSKLIDALNNEDQNEPHSCDIIKTTTEQPNIPKNNFKCDFKPKNYKTDDVESKSNTETLFFSPSNFEIILLVDNNETMGAINVENDPFIHDLNKSGLNFEMCHLKVGDYTWICREKGTKNELVLPYIIERKRLDDLGSSIKDGRFHEQKFRLRQCGIQHVCYLIEKYGSSNSTTSLGIPPSSLQQAIINTWVHDDFSLKFTENLKGTVDFLTSATILLKKIFENKTLMSCPKENVTKIDLEDDLIPLMSFTEFNRNSNKKKGFTIKEMFISQLIQLKGLSVEKALAIVEKYPTPIVLRRNYEKLNKNEGEMLLSNLKFGKLKRPIGALLSATVFRLYGNSLSY